MIALLCAVQTEAVHLLASATGSKTSMIGSKSIVEATLADRRVLLCIGGMGKVNAAHAATILSGFNPSAIINFGIGGAYPSSRANIGDVAIAQKEIAGDEGVITLDGFKNTEYIGIPSLQTMTSVIYTTYPAQEPLVKLAFQTILTGLQGRGNSVHMGPFVTLSTCTGTMARARELEERYHGLCENMEGVAVAQVATLHNIPWIEVRGISNIVEDRDLQKWDITSAANAVQQAVLHVLGGWV
jgi:futalosine hydrolase